MLFAVIWVRDNRITTVCTGLAYADAAAQAKTMRAKYASEKFLVRQMLPASNNKK